MGSTRTERGIPPEEALSRLGLPGWTALDVRSEVEFGQGALPGFVNLPVLRTAERHEVGLTYAKLGPEAAVRAGHTLVDPDRERRVDAWCAAAGDGLALVCCWRGGLRSKIAAEWIEARSPGRAHRVSGGYKALRTLLVPKLADPGRLWVLSGFTGSGKTSFLRSLPTERFIDLEGLAVHRGSAFGAYADRPQPPQATFENSLGLQLTREPWAHLVEDESSRVGRIHVPHGFKLAMRRAPVLVLETSLEERARNIHAEYVAAPLAGGEPVASLRERLQASTRAVAEKLGNERCAQVLRAIAAALERSDPTAFERHEEWITTLLVDYYDKLYLHAFEEQSRPVAFRGTEKECREWILKQFDSPRP